MAKLMTLEGFRKLERRDFENGAVLAQIDILHRCPRRECHGVGGQTIDASLSRMRVHDVPWRAVLDFEEVLAGEEGNSDG